jgi:gamma-glutamyl-gamma-aminobutyraldehyde dehydrogenase
MTRSRQDWSAIADGLSLRTHAFVDGRPVPARDGSTRPTVSPASGKVLADVADCGRGDVDAAVVAARRAFVDGRWSRQAPGVRRGVLLALADLIDRHRDEFALLDTLDAGKLITDTHSLRPGQRRGPSSASSGFGQSGFGRDLSLHALDKFTGLKTTWIRHG